MKGEIWYLYAFDVANEIGIAQITSILGQKPFAYEIREHSTIPKDIPLYHPLAIEGPPLSAQLDGQPVRTLIRVYEVGVITIAMRADFSKVSLTDLLPCHQPKLTDGKALDEAARDLCMEVYDQLKPFMIRPTPPNVPEAYTVFCVTDLPGVEDVNQWLATERRNVAGLLAETDPTSLSEAQVAEVLRLERSYEKTDLVVIDWDAALVVDLTGYVEDVLYVLELANLQLEEFHALDRTLDRYLNRAYEDLEKRAIPLFGLSTNVLRALRRFRVDLTKLADEVTHITKFLGDWHLARVYVSARERFYLDQWRASVERRLAQLDQIYSVVHSDIYEQRMFWLEIIIVILFAIDILVILFYRS
jgi:hypothetical protein